MEFQKTSFSNLMIWQFRHISTSKGGSMIQNLYDYFQGDQDFVCLCSENLNGLKVQGTSVGV
jgi:hypothetical protein